MILKALVSMIIVVSLPFTTSSTKEELAHNYINNNKDLAIAEMYRSGIPASITLAQALHESNYGTSDLATKANNHFGIKCKSDWMGQTYFHKDDDYENGQLVPSCFRSYADRLTSFADHSDFLMNSSNYTALFGLSNTDYLNWAHGLKKAGYATDPDYAIKLIKKIEKYNLSQYDFWDKPIRVQTTLIDKKDGY